MEGAAAAFTAQPHALSAPPLPQGPYRPWSPQAVEAYHAGLVRRMLFDASNTTVAAYNVTVEQIVQVRFSPACESPVLAIGPTVLHGGAASPRSPLISRRRAVVAWEPRGVGGSTELQRSARCRGALLLPHATWWDGAAEPLSAAQRSQGAAAGSAALAASTACAVAAVATAAGTMARLCGVLRVQAAGRCAVSACCTCRLDPCSMRRPLSPSAPQPWRMRAR